MNMEMAGDNSHFAVDKRKEWNKYQYHRIVHSKTNSVTNREQIYEL